jgi:hypothetical protein
MHAADDLSEEQFMSDPNWRKPRRSFSNGNCVEVGSWRTPSRSMGNGNCVEAASWRKPSGSLPNGQCLEAASGVAAVLVRDTKDRGGAVLTFPAAAWTRFAEAVKTP